MNIFAGLLTVTFSISVIWLKGVNIFTARVRSTTGGYVFTGVCSGGGGVPQSQVLGQVSSPRSFPEEYLSPGQGGGGVYPSPGLGYPSPGQSGTPVLIGGCSHKLCWKFVTIPKDGSDIQIF